MSKTMPVTFRGAGFWAYDIVASVLLKHLIDAAQPVINETNASWLPDVLTHWEINAVIMDNSAFYLNDDWTDEQTQTIQNILTRACHTLQSRENITTDEIHSWRLLNDERVQTRGHDIPTQSVIQLGQAIVALLQNTLEAPPSGTWWFYGVEKTRGTIAMRI